MKKVYLVVTMVICAAVFLLVRLSAREAPVKHMKDLDENMLDLRVYQENLGDEIKEGQLQDAEWLLTGMDSVLRVVSREFKEHRKLKAPFSKFYRRDLRPAIRGMQKAIDRNDTALALRSYKLLVKKCNGCHIDHDIDKNVNY